MKHWCSTHSFKPLGSLGGSRALFNLCAARPAPIPFFGELGSVNPMFILQPALAERTDQIASGWAGSLTMGAGQFCTKPGIAVVLEGPKADAVIAATRAALEPAKPQIMLTDGMADAYTKGPAAIAGAHGVSEVFSRSCPGRVSIADLYEVSGKDWLANHILAEDVLGPFALVVRAKDFDEMLAIARALQGQLTCTLHLDEADAQTAASLMPILTRKAGRLLANDFPTGVEVADAMVHGGPHLASTNFGATSMGTMAIRRWLRPVCFQNMSAALVPADLR